MGLEFEVNLKPQVDAISQPAWILETLLLDVSLRYEVEGLGELLPNLQQLLGGMSSLAAWVPKANCSARLRLNGSHLCPGPVSQAIFAAIFASGSVRDLGTGLQNLKALQ